MLSGCGGAFEVRTQPHLAIAAAVGEGQNVRYQRPLLICKRHWRWRQAGELAQLVPPEQCGLQAVAQVQHVRVACQMERALQLRLALHILVPPGVRGRVLIRWHASRHVRRERAVRVARLGGSPRIGPRRQRRVIAALDDET